MEINWIIIAIVFVAAFALIVFVVVKNNRDKKELNELLNTDTDIPNSTQTEKEIE